MDLLARLLVGNMKPEERTRSGFTLIEIIVVVSILTTLLGLILARSFDFRTSSSINSIVTTLMADIKNQQIKAMVGDTEGRGSGDVYGVYIQPTKYSLFHSSVYTATDSANFSVTLDAGLQLTTTFVGSTFLFASGSGQIINYSATQSAITLKDTATNIQKTIQLNKYGSIISLN